MDAILMGLGFLALSVLLGALVATLHCSPREWDR